MAGGVACIVALAAGCLLRLAGAADVSPGEYDPRYGTFVGQFNTLWHDVVGDVYAVDNTTVHIRGFTYDGEAPDAYFFAGNRTPKPTNRGFIIPNEKNQKEVLGPYKNRNLILKFPETPKGQRGFYDVKWISVWCERFAIDFGHVVLPDGMKTPAPVMGEGPLSSDSPLLSAPMVMQKDANTIVLEDFTYDGSVEDAILVAGSGEEDAAGVQLPDERGEMAPLRTYKHETLKLRLPKSLSGTTVQYVGAWSPTVGMIASVTMPADARVPPAMDNLV